MHLVCFFLNNIHISCSNGDVTARHMVDVLKSVRWGDSFLLTEYDHHTHSIKLNIDAIPMLRGLFLTISVIDENTDR